MYYRLTYIASSSKERRGDFIQNGNKPLNIGQGTSSEVRLPDSDMYEPQVFATILQREDLDGWYLIRRTDSHHVSINGSEVEVAQVLCQGDLLSFSDGTTKTELKFETFDDGEYDANSGIVYKKHKGNKRLFFAIFIVALMALGVSAIAMFQNQQKTNIRDIDLIPYTDYVYRINVDTVYLLHHVSNEGQSYLDTLESIELEKNAVGTAFLTDSGLMVTARHCIEPWIDDTEWDGSLNAKQLSPEMRLALRAETGNKTEGDRTYIVCSHCVITKGLERYEFYSTDFFMNKSRDLILRLGERNSPQYWRTITPVANKRDMELGDFAYVRIDTLAGKSKLTLANRSEMKELGKSGIRRELEIVGFPLLDNDYQEGVKVIPGRVMTLDQHQKDSKYSEGCIPLSADINRGNSGGPVLTMIGKEVRVIGIVSRVDAHADESVFWAVPSTEIQNLREHNDIIKEDFSTYRRR